MGAGLTKVLPLLFVAKYGEDTTEKKLVGGKMNNVVTTLPKAEKSKLNWKRIMLDEKNVELTKQNLKEASAFIHKYRAQKENVLVLLDPSDHDSLATATAYVMILSGLSPESATAALQEALKDEKLQVTDKFMPVLHALREDASPMQLRNEVFSESKEYAIALLTEDVTKVYELAGLEKPSMEQVKLQEPVIQQQQEPVKSLPAVVTEQDEQVKHSSMPAEIKSHTNQERHLDAGKTTSDPDKNIFQTLPTIKRDSQNHSDDENWDDGRVKRHSEEADEQAKRLVDEVAGDTELLMRAEKEHYVQSPIKREHSKIKLIYAIDKANSQPSKEVIDYFENTTDEERQRNRKPVKIIRTVAKMEVPTFKV